MNNIYLITGGSGFLGTHLCQALLKLNKRVLVVDLQPLSDIDLVGAVEFYQGDVRDKVLIDKLVSSADVVVHCAATLPLAPKHDIYSTNVEGTRNILETSLRHRKKVIHISSTAVYGISEKHPIYEDDPLVGVGHYSKTKIIAENLCQQYRDRGAIIGVVRPKTFIGIGRLGVFQILFDWVKDGKKIPIIGSGDNRYQLLGVGDLVDFIIAISNAEDKKVNNTYNVGAKRFKTVREDFADLFAFAKTGSTIRTTPPRFVKLWLWIFEKMGLSPLYRWIYETADKDSFVSIEKAEACLDWTPQTSNAEALIQTYDWYLHHYKEYQTKQGITHTVPWKQGILKVIKWLS